MITQLSQEDDDQDQEDDQDQDQDQELQSGHFFSHPTVPVPLSVPVVSTNVSNNTSVDVAHTIIVEQLQAKCTKLEEELAKHSVNPKFLNPPDWNVLPPQECE